MPKIHSAYQLSTFIEMVMKETQTHFHSDGPNCFHLVGACSQVFMISNSPETEDFAVRMYYTSVCVQMSHVK